MAKQSEGSFWELNVDEASIDIGQTENDMKMAPVFDLCWQTHAVKSTNILTSWQEVRITLGTGEVGFSLVLSELAVLRS